MKYISIKAVRGIYEIRALNEILKRHGGLIIGGYARWVCSERKRLIEAGDIDIFPVGESEEHCHKVFNNLRSEFLDELKFEIKYENDVSLSLKTDKDEFKHHPPIQLIKPIRDGAIVAWGTLEEILNNFDFSITRVALTDIDRGYAIACESFLEDEKRGELILKNIHCPVSSLMRSLKYVRKGYYMRPSEAMKLFEDWDLRDNSYRKNLSELFSQLRMGEITQEEIDELERLLRID